MAEDNEQVQEQAQETPNEPRMVRLRLLKNFAAPGGPCGQIGEYIVVDEVRAQSLIEAEAAVEVDWPEAQPEVRAEPVKPNKPKGGKGSK